jgi:hypothetical protein
MNRRAIIWPITGILLRFALESIVADHSCNISQLPPWNMAKLMLDEEFDYENIIIDNKRNLEIF